jgi:hypothetical protein
MDISVKNVLAMANLDKCKHPTQMIDEIWNKMEPISYQMCMMPTHQTRLRESTFACTKKQKFGEYDDDTKIILNKSPKMKKTADNLQERCVKVCSGKCQNDIRAILNMFGANGACDSGSVESEDVQEVSDLVKDIANDNTITDEEKRHLIEDNKEKMLNQYGKVSEKDSLIILRDIYRNKDEDVFNMQHMIFYEDKEGYTKGRKKNMILHQVCHESVGVQNNIKINIHGECDAVIPGYAVIEVKNRVNTKKLSAMNERDRIQLLMYMITHSVTRGILIRHVRSGVEGKLMIRTVLPDKSEKISEIVLPDSQKNGSGRMEIIIYTLQDAKDSWRMVMNNVRAFFVLLSGIITDPSVRDSYIEAKSNGKQKMWYNTYIKKLNTKEEVDYNVDFPPLGGMTSPQPCSQNKKNVDCDMDCSLSTPPIGETSKIIIYDTLFPRLSMM